MQNHQHSDGNNHSPHIYRYVDYFFYGDTRMNEANDTAKKLGDIVVDYISKNKMGKLEKAFKDNPKLMQDIREFSQIHNKWMSTHQRLMNSLKQMCNKQKCDTDL